MDTNKNNIDYSLCLVTDRNLMSTKTLEEAVSHAIEGGATMIQIREKNVASLRQYELAMSIKEITDRHNIPLIINDRVDIALAVGASGVHIGQSDIPTSAVRKIIPKEMLLGVSVTTAAEAKKAERDGADYIGVGAMYKTTTKANAKMVSFSKLSHIRKAVSTPIIVIGGINENNVTDFSGVGIDGIAVISAIISKPDIKEAAATLKQLLRHRVI